MATLLKFEHQSCTKNIKYCTANGSEHLTSRFDWRQVFQRNAFHQTLDYQMLDH